MSTTLDKIIQTVSFANNCLDLALKVTELFQKWNLADGADNEQHGLLSLDDPPQPGRVARLTRGRQLLFPIVDATGGDYEDHS
ncbi:hypothetical protein TWF481_004972 [Arthrobotrys musiformis]|uniref:Uncharacterized protein n=1 Tax=Arthrobotrys musiformis TaxID=47236 RepID=A0AAV9WL40_9PEZI